MKRLLVIFSICIYTNCFSQSAATDSITLNAQKLSKLLDSVHLDKFWLKGYNVDWLTGVSQSKAGASSTHCSAFASSFACKLGIYFLRPPQHSQNLLANAQCNWLASDSAKGLGWVKVNTALEAQNLANKGYLVMVGYKNPSSSSPGHMAIVRPSSKTLTQLQQDGPQEAQSGAINSNNITTQLGFSSHPLAWPNGVIYYQHSVNWDSLFTTINGRVITPSGNTIPSVRLGLSGTVITGSMLDNSTSTENGYTLSELVGGNYTIRASKKNDINKTNGVSVADALLIQSHILGKSILNSPYKLIAADVDGSGSVTTLDILYLKRFILGMDSTFKGNRLWTFVDSSFKFPNPSNPFPYKDSISIYGLNKLTDIKPTFIGVKLGDVQYDWNPSLFGAAATTSQPLSLYYDKIETGDNNLKVSVKTKGFNNLAGIQYTLNYNVAEFDFVGIENNNMGIEYATNHSAEGKIPLIWMSNNGAGKTLEDGTELMELVFKKKGYSDNIEISISSNPTTAVAWDVNLKKVAINQLIAKAITNTEEFAIYPNPSNGNIQIKWQVSNNKSVTLKLFNSMGKLLTQQTLMASSGVITTLDLCKKIKLPSGTYYLKASGLNENNVKQIIIK